MQLPIIMFGKVEIEVYIYILYIYTVVVVVRNVHALCNKEEETIILKTIDFMQFQF